MTQNQSVESKYADFAGPSDEERTQALRAKRVREQRLRKGQTGLHYSGNTIGGVPRNYKHKPTYNGRCAD